ncbi:acyl-CoA dehydrogenase family protein [Thalassovita taeanensis]|uniref:Acyl-CoA dehydrogenase n=1 Tax=Thalassovita taeanensis TaxID=657014 RepID=A0A1H9IG26_9RHOB|nr:acyl-CoA dehydrogenase family protein [Thalassovita taeanensis]SEQ73488.1 acyl-CoA dehydrogenase [Thalassovita taeanensis]
MNDDTNISRMLTDQLSRLLEASVDAPLLAKIEKGTAGSALNDAVAELGLDMALVPEDKDGAGLDWSDAAPLFEVLGYYAAPVDLGEQIIAQWALAQAGLPASDPAPAVALGLAKLSADGGLSGTVTIPWGSADRCVLVEAMQDDMRVLCLLDAAAMAASVPVSTVGRIPTRRLKLNGAAVQASGPLGAIGLGDVSALLRAAYIAGALSRALELTLDYCNTRTQFGRTIGKFQAVQQMVAQLASEAAAAKAGTQLGMTAMGSGNAGMQIAIAKQRASAAVAKSAAIAHEVHGAIGVTEEHILHYFTRRLWQWREEAGSEHVWAERLGREVIARGGAAAWPTMVGLSAR